MANDKRKKYGIIKWITLPLAILLNSFLILYSCLNEATTVKWNNTFTQVFANIFNIFSKKAPENISLEGISISFSQQDVYKYNYLSGYQLEEIPLGSAKQIECTFSPDNATNKSISYSISPSDSAILNQSGSTLSIVGMKACDATLTAKSSDGNFTSSIDLKIVDLVAPASFDVSVNHNQIAIGTTETINFDIDGGVLTHNELINFRYYDIGKLSYESSDESVAEVDNNGVIYPKSNGFTSITISNGVITKTLQVEVIDGATPVLYDDLNIWGSNVCYENDMILDQSSHSNHFQLTPRNGTTDLNPDDFIWSSSNELLARVDRHGVLRGFRKTTRNDEHVTITAVSKLTKQVVEFEVFVKNQIPTKVDFYYYENGEKKWNKTSITIGNGEYLTLYFQFTPSISVSNLAVEDKERSVLTISVEGKSATLHGIAEGRDNLKFWATANPDLTLDVEIIVIKAGQINRENIGGVTRILRKSVGHAAVFAAAQLFTFLTLFFFLYDRKIAILASFSLGQGLVFSILSELIQLLIPSRSGAVLDAIIDFGGVIFGFAIALAIVLIIKSKEKKQNKTISSDEDGAIGK